MSEDGVMPQKSIKTKVRNLTFAEKKEFPGAVGMMDCEHCLQPSVPVKNETGQAGNRGFDYLDSHKVGNEDDGGICSASGKLVIELT